MLCPNCGKENADTAQECFRCHVPLHDEDPAPAAAEEHHGAAHAAPAAIELAPMHHQAADDAAAASSEDLGEVCRRCETYNPPGTRRCTSCGLKLISDGEPEAASHSGSPSVSHADPAYEQLAADPGGEERTPPTGLRADFGQSDQGHTRAEPPTAFASDTPAEGHPSLSDELSALALSDEDARDAMGDAHRAEPAHDRTPPDGMPSISDPLPPPAPSPLAPPTPPPPARPARAKEPAPVVHAEPEAPKPVARSRPVPPPPAAPPIAAAPVATPPPPLAAPAGEKLCSSCAEPNPLNAKFCAECGTPFPKAVAAKPTPASAAVPVAPAFVPTPPPPPKPPAPAPSPAAPSNAQLSTDPSSKRLKPVPSFDSTAEQPAVVIAQDEEPPSDTNAEGGGVEVAAEEPAFEVTPEEAFAEPAPEEFVEEVAPPDEATAVEAPHEFAEGAPAEEAPAEVFAEEAAAGVVVEDVAHEAPVEAVAEELAEALPPPEPEPEATPEQLPPYQVSVVVEKGANAGTTFMLGHLENTLGGAGAAVELSEDPHLAPTQASLLFDDQRLLVRDEGAANGVFIKMKEPAQLQPGDLFIAGERLLRFDGPIDLALGEETDTPFQGAPRPAGATVRVTEVLLGGRTGRICHRSGPTIAVGKAGCDMNFPADTLLAPRHAEIHLGEDGSATLVDVGGVGVLLRLRTQATHELSAGDVLQIGDQVLRIEVG